MTGYKLISNEIEWNFANKKNCFFFRFFHGEGEEYLKYREYSRLTITQTLITQISP